MEGLGTGLLVAIKDVLHNSLQKYKLTPMNNKKWYTSKTIIASIITLVISALEITQSALLGGGIDDTAIITIITSVVAIYGRITAKDFIE
jgi:hypothetical protein